MKMYTALEVQLQTFLISGLRLWWLVNAIS